MKCLWNTFAILLFFGVVFSSCSFNGKSIVLNYLKENTNGTTYEIIDISKADSLFSPMMEISSLTLSKSRALADLTKQLTEAFNKPTRKERREAAQKVAELAGQEYEQKEVLDEIVVALTDPSASKKDPNRVAYQVTYKVDGRLREDVFFKETNKNSIGHTLSELKTSYLKLCDINGDLYRLKCDAKDLANTMQ